MSKADSKTSNAPSNTDAKASVSMVATASFSSPKNEGAVKKGQAFETTPERAAFLEGRQVATRAK